MVERCWRLAGEAEEFGAQVGAGCRPAVGIAGQQPVDEVDEPARQRRTQARQVGRIALQPGEGRVGVGLTDERNAARQAFVEDKTERVEVGASVEAASAHLLRRQVLGRTHHHVVAGQVVTTVEALGDAEVGQQHSSVRGHQDVAGLDVAVDEAGPVGGVEGGGDTRADVDRQFRAEAGLDVEQLTQALAVDELHHDGLTATLGEDIVDGDDVRMRESSDGDGLATESLGDDRVGRQARFEPLQGDATVEREVGSQPHFGHAALRQPALQSVAPGENDRSVALFGRRAWSWGRGRSRHSATSN